VCPSGCDQALYDKVLALRERRLDREDVIAEFNKVASLNPRPWPVHPRPCPLPYFP